MNENIPIVLIENKVDLVPNYKETDENFFKFAKFNKFSDAFRTSVKTGINLNESMNKLIDLIIKSMNEASDSNDVNSIILERTTAFEKNNKNKCC